MQKNPIRCMTNSTFFRFLRYSGSKQSLNSQQMKNFLFFGILVLLFATACSNTYLVEVKNDEGQLLEKFEIRKTDSLRHGSYEAFYPSGKLMERAEYKEGRLDGLRQVYLESGALELEESWKKGKFEGDYIVYFQDGSIQQTGQYIDNKMTGEWKTFYQNGQLKEIVPFENNEENGQFVEYYENGQLKAKGVYKRGPYEEGMLELYKEDGTMERKMRCVDGGCQTIWTPETGDIVPETEPIPRRPKSVN